jgi:hypothetical protein
MGEVCWEEPSRAISRLIIRSQKSVRRSRMIPSWTRRENLVADCGLFDSRNGNASPRSFVLRCSRWRTSGKFRKRYANDSVSRAGSIVTLLIRFLARGASRKVPRANCGIARSVTARRICSQARGSSARAKRISMRGRPFLMPTFEKNSALCRASGQRSLIVSCYLLTSGCGPFRSMSGSSAF